MPCAQKPRAVLQRDRRAPPVAAPGRTGWTPAADIRATPRAAARNDVSTRHSAPAERYTFSAAPVRSPSPGSRHSVPRSRRTCRHRPARPTRIRSLPGRCRHGRERGSVPATAAHDRGRTAPSRRSRRASAPAAPRLRAARGVSPSTARRRRSPPCSPRACIERTIGAAVFMTTRFRVLKLWATFRQAAVRRSLHLLLGFLLDALWWPLQPPCRRTQLGLPPVL